MQSSTFWTTADYKRQLWDMYPNVSREYILDAHRAHYMFYASPPGAEPHVQRMLAGTIHAHDMVRDYRVEIVHGHEEAQVSIHGHEHTVSKPSAGEAQVRRERDHVQHAAMHVGVVHIAPPHTPPPPPPAHNNVNT